MAKNPVFIEKKGCRKRRSKANSIAREGSGPTPNVSQRARKKTRKNSNKSPRGTFKPTRKKGSHPGN